MNLLGGGGRDSQGNRTWCEERGLGERRGGLWRRKPSRAVAPSLVRGLVAQDYRLLADERRKRNGNRSELCASSGLFPGLRERLAAYGFLGLAAALVIFFVVLTPTVANAVMSYGVVWGPQSIGSNGDKGVVVIAGNAFSAAAIELGKNPNDHQLFTDAAKSKLSNAATGGRFYEFVQTFQCYGAGTDYSASNLPPWAGAARLNMDPFFYTWASGYGDSQVWWSTYSPRLRSSALEDLNTVLSGGDLGGGSGGSSGEVGDYLEFTGGVRFSTSTYTRGFVSNGEFLAYASSRNNMTDDSYKKMPEELTVRLPSTLIASVLEQYPLDDYKYTLDIGSTTGSSGSIDHFQIILTPSGTTQYSKATNTVYSTNEYISGVSWSGTGRNVFLRYINNLYTLSDNIMTIRNSTNISIGSVTTSSLNALSANSGRQMLASSLQSTPTLPDNRWPEDDPQPTPTPPTVPEPDPPTPTPTPDPPVEPTPEPEPNPPVFDPYTPTNPIVYSPVIEPTNTSNTDYTPWLRAIFLQLVNIGSDFVAGLNNIVGALDDHCEHLQDAIGKWVQWLSRSMGTRISNQRLKLQANLQELFDGLHVALADELYDAIYNLELYMKEQMEWLAEQLQFDVSGGSFDDSTVVSWLKKIYLKMQGQSYHPPTVRPTDPELETGFDWWSWLIDTLVSLLGNGAADTVDTIVGILEEMQRLFPFSIPWDLAAVFAALVAAPLTPVFDVTIPAIDGWWGAVVFHVDLSPYDGAAEVVRSMWVVWFTVVLIMRTDWLVGVFETGARVVTQFLDRL